MRNTIKPPPINSPDERTVVPGALLGERPDRKGRRGRAHDEMAAMYDREPPLSLREDGSLALARHGRDEAAEAKDFALISAPHMFQGPAPFREPATRPPSEGSQTQTVVPHPRMDPQTLAMARRSEAPDISVYDRPFTDRASSLNLWVTGVIVAILLVGLAMTLWTLYA